MKVGALFERGRPVTQSGRGPNGNDNGKRGGMMIGTNFWRNLGLIVLVLLSTIFVVVTYKQLTRPEPDRFIDARLQGYYDSFLRDAKQAGLKPGHEITRLDIGPIDEKELGPNVIGVCYKTPHLKGGKIYMSYAIRVAMVFYSEPVMKGLMYHELAHCVYDLDHSPDRDDIMYWEIQWEVTAEQRDQQIIRMFQRIKKNQ